MNDTAYSLRLTKPLKNKIRRASRLTNLGESDVARLAIDQGIDTLLVTLGKVVKPKSQTRQP
jgi:hypothetical protein